MGKYRFAPPTCVDSVCVVRSVPSDLGGVGRWAAGIAMGAVFAYRSLGERRLLKVGFSFLLGKKKDRVAFSSLWCEWGYLLSFIAVLSFVAFPSSFLSCGILFCCSFLASVREENRVMSKNCFFFSKKEVPTLPYTYD